MYIISNHENQEQYYNNPEIKQISMGMEGELEHMPHKTR